MICIVCGESRTQTGNARERIKSKHNLCDARVLAMIAIEIGLHTYEATVIMRCLDMKYEREKDNGDRNRDNLEVR
jgi:hypothetical protein